VRFWPWLKRWAATFKTRPEVVEVDQLAATRAILEQEIENAKAGDIVECDGPLEFAANFERQAALELIAFVKSRRQKVTDLFKIADAAGWNPLTISTFWGFEDVYDPNALDPAIGGLRGMAEAMRLEATR